MHSRNPPYWSDLELILISIPILFILLTSLSYFYHLSELMKWIYISTSEFWSLFDSAIWVLFTQHPTTQMGQRQLDMEVLLRRTVRLLCFSKSALSTIAMDGGAAVGSFSNGFIQIWDPGKMGKQWRFSSSIPSCNGLDPSWFILGVSLVKKIYSLGFSQ